MIIKEEPYCHVLSAKYKEVRCDYCFLHNACNDITLKLCTQCRIVKYCGVSCQRAAWQLHKEECKKLKRVSPKIPTDSVLLLHRLLILKQLGQDKVNYETKFGSRTFKDLMSHKEEIKNDPQRTSDFMAVMHTLKIYLGESTYLPDATDLLEIFGKMCINSFTICDGEMQPLGVGIYLGGSILDHSCRPNAVVTFNGITLQVVSEDKYTSEKPLFISYIEQLSTTKERQTQLQQQYYFTCQCTGCQDQQRDKQLLSTHCPALNCDEIIKESEGKFEVCSKCGFDQFDKLYKNKKHTVLQECKSSLCEVETLCKQQDHESALTKCASCLQNYQSTLSSINIYHVRLLEKAFDCCVQLNLWDKAVAYGKAILEPYRKYYDKHHPLLGVHLMKLGKVELYLQLWSEATLHLQQAESILAVNHGRSHTLYRDLITLLEQCAEERRVQLEEND